MRISLPIKIILGLLTAWVVIAPFCYVVAWFSFIFSSATTETQSPADANAFFSLFIPVVFFIMCTSLLTLGLKAFYIVHIIINKSGSDVLRAVFGVGIFIFSTLAMPVYYFIYILPQNPPEWALARNSTPVVTQSPLQP